MAYSDLEIYDCTLREGEQMEGASFSSANRLEIAVALDSLGVDYIELGWPVLKSAMKAFHEIRKLDLRSKVVAFGSTSMHADVKKDRNLEALVASKAEYACIFGKSSLEHVQKQLQLTPEENIRKIHDSVRFLIDRNMKVFYDAEHYFDSFKHDRTYALESVNAASGAGAEVITLCDSNGGVLYNEVAPIIKETALSMPKDTRLGVHFHDDLDMALVNALESLPYVQQVQATVNGLGERLGNTDLCSLLPILLLKKNMSLNISREKLKNLRRLSSLVYNLSGISPQIRQPFVSEQAFAHKGGIHIDAMRKGASYEHINPEYFDAERKLIFSSIGGRACVFNTAEKLGYSLDKDDEETKGRADSLLLELSELEAQGSDIGIESRQHLLIRKYFGYLTSKPAINNGRD